jgi:adenine deaminase
MSDRPAAEVEARLRTLRACLRTLGCTLDEPFVQMAFLPLSVIPHLKITDRGLIDVGHMQIINLDS